MPTYRYEAMNAAGLEHHDDILAGSKDEAIVKIRSFGYFPTRVDEIKEPKEPVRPNVKIVPGEKIYEHGPWHRVECCAECDKLITSQKLEVCPYCGTESDTRCAAFGIRTKSRIRRWLRTSSKWAFWKKDGRWEYKD